MNLYVNNQIDYGSGSFVVTTDSELTRMNQEELTFRSYYRMMQKLDRCNEEEQLYRQKLYEQALCQNHVIPGAPIQNMTAESIGMTGSLAMLKRSRYFPPFLYQHENFEMFYIHSGQCTHICKGPGILAQAGGFLSVRIRCPSLHCESLRRVHCSGAYCKARAHGSTLRPLISRRHGALAFSKALYTNRPTIPCWCSTPAPIRPFSITFTRCTTNSSVVCPTTKS